MKTTIILFILLFAGTQFLHGKQVTGKYETNFGELTLIHMDSKVTGTYSHENGRVEGSIIGTTMTGWWYQNNGKGRFIFKFASDFSSFDGLYGYDDAEPSTSWDGKRIGEIVLHDVDNSGITGVYNTDFDRMMLTRRGNRIGGNYKHMDGRIDGILEGNTVTGTWHQSNGEGKLIFVFAPDFSSFEGKWGRNSETPSAQWNGKKFGSGSGSSASTSSSTTSTSAKKLYGTFNSDFNRLTFHQSGNNVSGNYEHSNGRIKGKLNGNVLTGWWYQDNGKGRFRFVFNSEFSSFTGKWSYDDAEPSGTWNGSK